MEERKMILEMLRNGSISVEEAERLLTAIEGTATESIMEEVTDLTVVPGAPNRVKPKRLRVECWENGKKVLNVRIPYSLLKFAGKLGTNPAVLRHAGEDAQILSDLDLSELFDQVQSGEIELPYTVVEVEEEDKADGRKGDRVYVVLE